MIQKCENSKCVSAYQDQRYGKGMRAHTTDKNGKHHCTVCGGKDRAQVRCAQHAAQWTAASSMPSNKASVRKENDRTYIDVRA